MKKIAIILTVLVLLLSLVSCLPVVKFDFPEEKTEESTDMIELANRVSDELLTSMVKVTTDKYNTGFFGNITSSSSSSGSGVIFMESLGYYFVLTNYHVIENEEEYKNTLYTVYDCYGTEYNAALIASDSTYDLAVLRFSMEEPLGVVDFAEDAPSAESLIVSVGAPRGIMNSVTYGNVLDYKQVEVNPGDSEEMSDVSFAVGWHSSPIDHGSSGGGVFDENLKLVGINYATGYSDNGEFLCGLFIPINKVTEFLKKYEIIS